MPKSNWKCALIGGKYKEARRQAEGGRSLSDPLSLLPARPLQIGPEQSTVRLNAAKRTP